MKKIYIAGVAFNKIRIAFFKDYIKKNLQNDKKCFIVTPNPEIVVEANKDNKYKDILNSADISIPDGIGIIWASNYVLKRKRNFIKALVSIIYLFFNKEQLFSILPERVTGVDLFEYICKHSTENKRKIFLLGAAPGVAEKVKQAMEKKYEGINIVGTYAGSPDIKEEQAIINRIDNSNAEILFVAYGAPKQEYWIKKNLYRIKQLKIAAGIGGSFDFIAGIQKRAPKIIRSMGFEWLWRLFREPKRIKRIYNATFRFINLVVKQGDGVS